MAGRNFIPLKSLSKYVFGNRQQPVACLWMRTLLYSCSVVFPSDPSSCLVFRNGALRSPGTCYLHIPQQTNQERVNTELAWQKFTSLWNYFVKDKLIKPSRKGLNLHLTVVPWGGHVPRKKELIALTLQCSSISITKGSSSSNKYRIFDLVILKENLSMKMLQCWGVQTDASLWLEYQPKNLQCVAILLHGLAVREPVLNIL